MAAAVLSVPAMIERCVSATTLSDTEKTRVNTQVWGMLVHPEPHSEVREGGVERSLKSDLGVPKVSWVHSFFIDEFET